MLALVVLELELERVPELALGRAVQVGLVALEVQEVPAAAIPEWISKKQVEKKECRRHHPRIRQAASSLDAPGTVTLA